MMYFVLRVAAPGLVLLLLCSPAMAVSAGERALLHARVEEENIYADRGWLALLHYRKSRWREQWTSEADSDAFFLSPDGRNDPRAELMATVDALLFDDPQARCRFPARFMWLQQRLAVMPEIRAVDACPELRAWYEPLAATRISINFASAYLENPSSLFGHTFLRLYATDSALLLTPTINYAANTSRQRGQLDFVVRGLFGGFPGVADQLPYFRRLRTYADDEGRDIWEYPLQLEPGQIELLLLHVWEVKDGIFDYYFLDENCAWRTLALIDVARPDLELLEDFDGPVIPVDTIRVLRDRGLIVNGNYWPSSSKRVSHHAEDLSGEETRWMLELAAGSRRPDSLETLTPERRARVMAVAAEYLAIGINRDQRDRDLARNTVQTLLRERLAANNAPTPGELPKPTPPEDSHAGRLFSAGRVERGGRAGWEIGFAPFEHRLTSPLPGYEPHAEVRVLSARYRFNEGGDRALESVDWLRVVSQMPSTALFQQPAWSLHLSRERKSLDRGRPLLHSLGFAAGPARQTPLGVAAVTMGADLDAGSALSSSLAVEGLLNVTLTGQRALCAYQFFYQYGQYLYGDNSHRRGFGARLGIPLGVNYALQLDIQRDGAALRETQWSAAFNYYF